MVFYVKLKQWKEYIFQMSKYLYLVSEMLN